MLPSCELYTGAASLSKGKTNTAAYLGMLRDCEQTSVRNLFNWFKNYRCSAAPSFK